MSPAPRARPDLLLFTQEFPFGTSETFLEPELPHLAAAFERVTLVPRWCPGQPRSLPTGIAVDATLADSHRVHSRAGSLARSLADARFYGELHRRPATLLQPAAADRLVGHVASASRVESWLAQRITAASIHLERTLCYTYWLWVETIALGRLRRRHPGMRIVSRAHGYDVYPERHRPPYIPLQAHALSAADVTFAVSSHGCRRLRDMHAHAAGRIEVSRLGVRDPGARSRRSSDGTLRLLTCSRIEEVKRLDRAVAAIASLARRRPELSIDWTHFGDGSLATTIRALAHRTLPGTVRWVFHGDVPNARVLAHYREQPVDVVLNTSASEGVPVSLMEAQSFGVPIVAPAVGGIPEIVDDRCGVLLAADPSPEQIACALDRFTRSGSELDRLRDGSVDSWRSRYDADANFNRFVETIRSLG